MRFELYLAWREIRPAIHKFVFMVAAITLGVGALTGIKGFSRALTDAMNRSARDLVAADLSVRMSSAPDNDELALLESLVKRGATMTRVTETLSMASTGRNQPPILSTIKAVDPAHYPFYGRVQLDPDLPLAKALQDDTVIASQDLLIRGGVGVGDSIRIGVVSFRIAAILREEPDRLASGVDMGPRILMTRKGLERSELIQFGSRATESFLFKLPERGFDLETAREDLRSGLQRRARISDYTNPNPSVSRGLEQMTNFLSLIGLLALLVGGLGVATTVHAYLQQKLDTIAIMKCLGGRSGQIVRIYLIQGMALGAIGSLLGVGLGYVIQLLFPGLLRGLLDLPTRLTVAPGVAAQGFLIGVAATLLFLLPPLLAIREVRPARVFLREMPETRLSTIRRLRHDPLPMLASLVLLFGVCLLASWLAGSLRRGFAFMAGLAGAIVVLVFVARLLLWLLKALPRPSSLALRHGLRNLNRPGSHVASILVAIGLGVAFVLTVYFIQTSLISQLIRGAPANFPNFFLLGITERDKQPLWDFLSTREGVPTPGLPIPAVPARLVSVDGRTADQADLDMSERRYFRTEFVLTWAAELPPDSRILEGSWWKAPYASSMISVGNYAARELRIGIGSTLEFISSGKVITGKVANIRDAEFARPGTSNQFIFPPGALDGLPTSYYGAMQVDRSAIVGLQKDLFARFPTVTSIDAGQVLIRVQELIDKIVNVIRFIALFSILAGVIILASSVASTRYQRVREAVLLKTLGATRSQVSRIQSAEFLVIGLTAGLTGGLLAAAAANYLLGTLLDTDFDFRWLPLLVATLTTSLLAIVTGWFASRGILNHKPLEILREN
jgi:putative ABC transport system permease protein